MKEPEQDLIRKLRQWAEAEPEILGLALVGSHARAEAASDSDIDIVLIASRPQRFIDEPEWVNNFGLLRSLAVEDWGRVTSLRVYYESGLEVEFAVTSPDWTDIPLDEGTHAVISGGMRIVLDKEGLLDRALSQLRAGAAASHRPRIEAGSDLKEEIENE